MAQTKITENPLNSLVIHDSHAFEKTLEARKKEFESKGIDFIILEICLKHLDSSSTRLSLFVELGNNAEDRRHIINNAKAKEYGHFARTFLVSASVFGELGGVALGQNVTGNIFQLAGKAIEKTDQLRFGDGRNAKVTLWDHANQGLQTQQGEFTDRNRKEEQNFQKILDLLKSFSEQQHNSARTAMGS
jgi:hypothetical protein